MHADISGCHVVLCVAIPACVCGHIISVRVCVHSMTVCVLLGARVL